MTDRYAKYHVRVHAENRHAGYGTPATIIAATKKDAVARAIDIVWGDYQRQYARVTIDRVEDLLPNIEPEEES